VRLIPLHALTQPMACILIEQSLRTSRRSSSLLTSKRIFSTSDNIFYFGKHGNGGLIYKDCKSEVIGERHATLINVCIIYIVNYTYSILVDGTNILMLLNKCIANENTAT